MIRAIKLVLKEKAIIDVYYFDRTVKRFDVLSLVDKYPQFKELTDRNLFLKGRLMGWSAIVWNDELDVDTEYIYEDGIDVSKEYSDIEHVVLGYKIKLKRLEQELSQEELAEKVGIDQSDLSKIEKGNANPSLKMISRIAKGLNSKVYIDIK